MRSGAVSLSRIYQYCPTLRVLSAQSCWTRFLENHSPTDSAFVLNSEERSNHPFYLERRRLTGVCVF